MWNFQRPQIISQQETDFSDIVQPNFRDWVQNLILWASLFQAWCQIYMKSKSSAKLNNWVPWICDCSFLASASLVSNSLLTTLSSEIESNLQRRLFNFPLIDNSSSLISLTWSCSSGLGFPFTVQEIQNTIKSKITNFRRLPVSNYVAKNFTNWEYSDTFIFTEQHLWTLLFSS